MPKAKPRNKANPDNGGIRISSTMLTMVGAAFALIVGIWTIVAKVATKSDVAAIATELSPRLSQDEDRIRNLELQNAAHFGASPTSVRSADEVSISGARFLLAQYPAIPGAQGAPPSVALPPAQGPQALPVPVRIVVVPNAMIKLYGLKPTRGGTYALLGEDGKYYSLDDVLAAHFSGTYREK